MSFVFWFSYQTRPSLKAVLLCRKKSWNVIKMKNNLNWQATPVVSLKNTKKGSKVCQNTASHQNGKRLQAMHAFYKHQIACLSRIEFTMKWIVWLHVKSCEISKITKKTSKTLSACCWKHLFKYVLFFPYAFFLYTRFALSEYQQSDFSFILHNFVVSIIQQKWFNMKKLIYASSLFL